MELLFVVLIAAGLGFIAHYAIPGRETRGSILLGAIAAIVASVIWVSLLWLGFTFDGGPTVTAHIDDLRTVDESDEETIVEIAEGGKTKMLLAHGRLKDFAACFALVKRAGRKGICIDREAAELLGVKEGDTVLAVKR